MIDITVLSGLVLGAVLGVTALSKWSNLSWFVQVVERYQLFRRVYAPPVAIGIVTLETFASLLLLSQMLSPVGPVIASLLLIAFTGAIAINLAKGRHEIDCGCLSSTVLDRLNWWLVVRNLGLLLLAALAGLDIPSTGLANALFGLALLLSVGPIVAVRQRQSGVMTAAT